MRLKMSWTIEEDVVNWLQSNMENRESVSELVNEILLSHIHTTTDPFAVIHSTDMEINKLEQKKKELLKPIEKILEEGNKKEREKAKKLLKDEKEKYESIQARIKQCYAFLEEQGLMDDYNNAKTKEDINSLSIKCIKIVNAIREEQKEKGVDILDRIKSNAAPGFIDFLRMLELSGRKLEEKQIEVEE